MTEEREREMRNAEIEKLIEKYCRFDDDDNLSFEDFHRELDLIFQKFGGGNRE